MQRLSGCPGKRGVSISSCGQGLKVRRFLSEDLAICIQLVRSGTVNPAPALYGWCSAVGTASSELSIPVRGLGPATSRRALSPEEPAGLPLLLALGGVLTCPRLRHWALNRGPWQAGSFSQDHHHRRVSQPYGLLWKPAEAQALLAHSSRGPAPSPSARAIMEQPNSVLPTERLGRLPGRGSWTLDTLLPDLFHSTSRPWDGRFESR